MKVLLDNSYITLKQEQENDEWIAKLRTLIHERLDPEDPNRYHIATFRKHIWDGRIKVCKLKKDEPIGVPTGLYDELIEVLDEFGKQHSGFSYKVKDMRGYPLIPDKGIPDELTLSGSGVKTLEARDYQLDAVKKAIEEQRGVIISATGSGKSAVFYSLAKLIVPTLDLGERCLFIAPNTSIMNQIYDNTKAYLPDLSIGKWGDSKKELDNSIVCATIQSIHAALKKPEIKLTSAKDRQLKRLATKYYDDIIGSGSSYRNNLKLFVNNFSITKKYEVSDMEELKNLYYSIDSSIGIKKYFDNYKKRYAKLVKKKAGKKLDKYNEAVGFLDSIRMVVVDECLVGNTLIAMNDGTTKCIKDIKKGDILKDNNKVLDTIVHKEQPIWEIKQGFGVLKGTLSHPVAIKETNKITYKPMYQVKKGDLLVTDVNGTIPVSESGATNGTEDVYDLTTENGTFYANRVLNHNCHHSSASSYQEVLMELSNARMRIGLTGTLDEGKKTNNLLIKAVLGDVLCKIKDKYMIDNGFIAIPHILLIDEVKPTTLEHQVELELRRRNTPKGQADLTRYQIAYDLGVIHNEHRNALVARLTKKILSKDSAKALLIIVNSIEHGDCIKKELNKLGIESTFLQGKDDSDTRHSVITDVKQGSKQVLIGTTIMDEGVDIPNFRYFINCASGKSYNKLLQRIGRVVRLQEDKKDVFIFDIVDRTHRLLYNQAKERINYYHKEGFDIIGKDSKM